MCPCFRKSRLIGVHCTTLTSWGGDMVPWGLAPVIQAFLQTLTLIGHENGRCNSYEIYHSEMSKPPWAASNPLLQIYRIKANLTLWVKGGSGITITGILLDQEFCVAKAWLEDKRLLFLETKKFWFKITQESKAAQCVKHKILKHGKRHC